MVRRVAPLLLVVLALVRPAAAQTAADSVRAAFGAYRTALLAQDGPAVLRVVTRRMVDYYGGAVGLALDADSTTVASLGLVDRVMVLSLRHRVPADTVRAFSGASALAYGARHGWIDGEGTRLLSVGEVTVSGETAVAKAVVGKAPVPGVSFPFRREGGEWKLDLTSMLARGERDFERMAADMGETEDGFVAFALEFLTGRPLGLDVWQPLGRR